MIEILDMLKLVEIRKNFGEKQALKEVGFELEDKSITGLLGPNGAGKTTLMKIMTGFLASNGGKIIWKNQEVDTNSIENKMRIGYLPENNPLYPNMTPVEYLKMVAELKSVEKNKIKDDIKKVIKECGLSEVLEQKIETLSKGYKQRVGLAAAILGDPKILILDEPSSGLDPNQIIEIRKLVKKLARKKTVLLSTHILSEAKEICDRLVIINNGEIVLNKETDKIKNLEKKFVKLTT